MDIAERPSHQTSFIRYTLASLLATLVDFVVLILFTELFKFWYILSAVLGAISGGVVAFVLGRNWAFKSKHGSPKQQAIKYIWVWMGSIFLNIGLLYLFVEYMNLQYIISKVIVTVLVGIGFNYVLQRNFIFK